MIKANTKLRIFKQNAVLPNIVKHVTAVIRPVWRQFAVVSLLVVTIGVSVLYHNAQYSLSKTELTLVTRSTVNAKLIKETATEVSYNRVSEDHSARTSVVLAAAQDATGQTPYKAVLAKDGRHSLTFSDSQGDLSLTMTPIFTTGAGRQQQGRVVYPEGLSTSHVYTFKRNGIKEDIILGRAPGNTYAKSWALNLGDKLAAKLLPNGSVGFYSANPNLFGNVQATDQADKDLLAAAQKNGRKDSLAFIIPSPYILDSRGHKNFQDVKYQLTGTTLTLTATNLRKQSYPLSIDPSVVVTTTADFAAGTDDGSIDYSTANQIGRGGITTGAVGATTQQTAAFTTARYSHTSVVSGGYLYIIGGYDGTTDYNDIQYCPLNAGGSVGTCVQQTSAFTTARSYHTSVVYNGYLYVIGGINSGTPLDDIQHCPINSNGSVGTCVQQTAAFTTARYGHTSVVYNGYLYIIGGAGLDDIQHCPINSNGSVGTCVQQTSAFTTARRGHTSIVYNGYLYIIGGYDGSYLDDIQHCRINADGSVGTCVQQTAALASGVSFHTSIVSGGNLYVIGGYNGAYSNDINVCPINADGSVGTCTVQAAAFTTARSYHTSVVYNGYLYIIGGYDGTTYQNDIQYLLLGTTAATSTGIVGATVQQTAAFTTARWGHASVVYNGYLYIIGGAGNLNDIQHCPLDSNGSVGTCVQQTAAFTTGRNGHTSVVHNGYLYIIGGNNGAYQNDIQHCLLNADGSVGTCVQQTAAFTTARSEHTSVVYNGYLYIIGGNSYLNDIQHCPLNSNGSVGTCVVQGSAFTTARSRFTSVVYNGNLYIIGGSSAGGVLNDIQYCPINTNGSVGTCVQQTFAFTTARQLHTSVVYNGYLYIIGGTNGTLQNDIQHLAIAALPQVAHYERVVDLGRVVDSVDSIQFNGTAPCGVKLQYAVADTNGIFGTPATVYEDSMPGLTYALSNVTLTRYVRLILTLDDQSCGGTSTITDVTVNSSLLPPAVPTLSAPASGAISVSITPTFTLKTTDVLDAYAQYKILVYQSDCSTLVRTIDQTSSQTGWTGQDAQTSTAYVVSSTLGGSTLASHTYQAAALSYNTTYCWKAAAIDPGGSNTFGSYSTTRLFTTNQPPPAPTLTLPAAAQTGVSATPEFRLYATDVDNDYLRYKIDVCSTSNCSSIVRTIDETSSQTGWASQSQQSATAYSSGQTAIHIYQAAALSANTQYWWRAYAIDPAGTSTFSGASGIGTFTTAPATQTNVNIGGGTTFYGGTTIGQ
ncbi:MAG: kelch repeat-containing protein [Candidatus Saccharibacteria bacterium]